jgi:hypothetical protein
MPDYVLLVEASKALGYVACSAHALGQRAEAHGAAQKAVELDSLEWRIRSGYRRGAKLATNYAARYVLAAVAAAEGAVDKARELQRELMRAWDQDDHLKYMAQVDRQIAGLSGPPPNPFQEPNAAVGSRQTAHPTCPIPHR